MRQHEAVAQLAHVGVVVDDHVAGDGVLREPGRDLLRPASTSDVARVVSSTRPANPTASSISCSSATVLPCRQVDETTTSASPLVTISFRT
jgi:hypothetical protein